MGPWRSVRPIHSYISWYIYIYIYILIYCAHPWRGPLLPPEDICAAFLPKYLLPSPFAECAEPFSNLFRSLLCKKIEFRKCAPIELILWPLINNLRSASLFPAAYQSTDIIWTKLNKSAWICSLIHLQLQLLRLDISDVICLTSGTPWKVGKRSFVASWCETSKAKRKGPHGATPYNAFLFNENHIFC